MIESKIIKLSANENCYGCSEKVYKAIENKYRQVYAYPEMNPIKLKEKIALKHQVNLNNVIVGAGSVSLINNLIQIFSNPEEEIITFEKSFIAYGQLSQMHGRICKFAPLKELRCAPENLLSLINEKTKIIFIANPNNPTGTIITHNELEFLLNKIPKNIIVVHDEAYAEYVTDKNFPESRLLQEKFNNLVILRSFSKIYGLAGLRVGYAILDELHAEKIAKVQVPFSLNYLTSEATIAALDDNEFINRSTQLNAIEALFLFEALKKLGFNTVKSNSNFVYLWFESDSEKKKVYDKLFNEGIIICDLMVFGQEKSLRISIGDKETNSRIIEILS